MAEDDKFQSAVAGVAGMWPATPTTWSYSSLKDAEECPRRWMLSRAEYPALWPRHGYPPRPILPACLGDVVHRSLEAILIGLRENGCSSLSDPCAVQVLRDLGGYSKLVQRATEDVLSSLQGNPRIKARLGEFEGGLIRQLPDIRQRVQAIITRSRMEPALTPAPDAIAEHGRPALTSGSHPEVELRVPDLRFSGRADLLTVAASGCRITDYKSGAPNSHHADQLRIYALLWTRDSLVNPLGIPVEQLILAYATHEELVTPPSPAELEALESDLLDRMQCAETSLKLRPPPAYPSPAICGFCSVRHLCEDYWRTMPVRDSGFIDCEAIVMSQNGARSWLVELEPGRQPALLRTAAEEVPFVSGDRVRFLDVAADQDEEVARATITMTQGSEAFVLSRATG